MDIHQNIKDEVADAVDWLKKKKKPLFPRVSFGRDEKESKEVKKEKEKI